MHIRIHIPTLFVLLFLWATTQTASAQMEGYSKDRPLIILCDWDFAPYEYSNDNGQPDGYNVELLGMILKKLNIPHEFSTMEWTHALAAFEHRDGDLIVDRSYHYHGRPYVRSNNTLYYYRLCIASLPNAPKKTHLDDFTPLDTIVVKEDGYASSRLVDERHINCPIEYASGRDAIIGIANGRYNYFVWGENPLRWKIKEVAFNDSIRVDSIDIPDSDIRLVGYDKDLISAIDDEYARLEQSGELQKVLDKWFHPERVHNDASPITLIVLVGMVILTVIIFLLTRLIRFRIKEVIRKSEEINSMMSQTLSTGSNYVYLYDIRKNLVSNIHGNLLTQEMTMEEFCQRIHPKDKEECIKIFKNTCAQGSTEVWSFTQRWNAGTEDAPRWLYLTGNANVEMENGTPRYIVTAMRDITRDMTEERINHEMGQKYMKMFETNLVAMAFYGSDGYLIDINERMRKLCNFDKNQEAEKFFRECRLFDAPLFRDDFYPGQKDDFHICQHMLYPEFGIDCYVELRIHPTFDDKGELHHYIVTSRDLTQERDIYMELTHQEREINNILKEVERYKNQLNYLLKNSDTFLWEYTPANDLITVTTPDTDQAYKATLEQFCETAIDGDASAAAANIRQTFNQHEPYSVIHRFKSSPLEHHAGWHAINGIPSYDEQGNIVRYFGISRKITDLIQAQEKLKLEKQRAESSGKMKSAFLANMTHEIRTPLNAIVGFSDLLQLVDTQEERLEFIRIIRNNCDMLMRLINDILEASNMGQALAIEPKEVDFAMVFNDICQTLAQRVQEPGVEFIKDNPYDSYVTTLDKGRVQQVLTNFTTNAVKYTHQGHIKVGYRQERRLTLDEKGEAEGLYFYCEDTGAGIPKEQQASVFERFVKLNDFVQGTGLGLSICQNISERCNGHIGVTSEGPGHGSTFWMWIPCDRK